MVTAASKVSLACVVDKRNLAAVWVPSAEDEHMTKHTAAKPNRQAVTILRGVCALLMVLTVPLSMAQMQQAPMASQAQRAKHEPVGVDITPLAQGKRVGDDVPVEVGLRDGEGRPVTAKKDTPVHVQWTEPSGKKSETVVQIPAGASSKTTNIKSTEPGAVKVTAKHADDELLGTSNYILIVPSSPASKAGSRRKSRRTNGAETPTRPKPISEVHGARIVLAAFLQTESISTRATAPTRPQILLKVSGENDAQGIRADGKTYARIQVFWMGQRPPASNVQVWLTWSNGDLMSNPIVIRKGTISGEAHWTSTSPILDAHVAVVETNPAHVDFVGPKTATVRFAEPILGIDFANPPEEISIVDTTTLTARFYDPAGFPISTGTQRHFRFTSNSPVLLLKPQEDDIPPGRSEFSTLLLPTSLGTSRIEASIAGYKPVMHSVKVSGTATVLLSLIGGVLGGVLAYLNSQGKLWARILSGIIVALVASWAYVFVGLPHTDERILHTQVSVMFVSVLAAFAGVKVLGVIGRALNFGF